MQQCSRVDLIPAGAGGLDKLFLALIHIVYKVKCPILGYGTYPIDYSSKLHDNDQFDFIIVGAGSAGSVLASHLAKNSNTKVLLLEAGGYPSCISNIPALFFNLQGEDDDWQFSTEPSANSCLGFKNGRCLWPRGKGLGGSSTINAMIYIHGNRQNYDEWANMGNEGWDYDNVLSHMRQLENLEAPQLANSVNYGRGGPIPLTIQSSKYQISDIIMEAAANLGYPTLAQEDNLGYFRCLNNIGNGTRANAAKAFLTQRPNLKVALYSQVQKVIIEDGVAKGVLVDINGKTISLRAKKETILSAGSLITPQILMHSGVGPSNQLKQFGINTIADLQVGANLQDHLIFLGYYLKVPDDIAGTTNLLVELFQYVAKQDGLFAGITMSDVLGFINTKKNSTYANIQLYHVLTQKGLTADPLATMISRMGYNDKSSKIMMEAGRTNSTLLIASALLQPYSRGYLQLQSKNPKDKLLIHSGYLEDKRDLDTVLESIQYLETLLNTSPLKEYGLEVVNLLEDYCKETFRSKEYWTCAVRHLSSTIYHPVGTAKMGPDSDPEAVVDPRLRVRGIKGLRVVDASIMPKVISGNTNALAMTIGLKGGIMIEEDWKAKAA